MGNIQLPDVDEHTGHTLAHFLCTGTYQTLQGIEVSPEEEARIEFKRAFSAFVTANTYELAELQRLAMQNVKQHGNHMTIFDIVCAIDEDFSRLSDGMNDFQGYLTTKAKDTFQKDHNYFFDNMIFDHITNVALSKTLANCVMELYRGKITQMLQAERLMYGLLAKHNVIIDREVGGEEKGGGEQETGDVISKNKGTKREKDAGMSHALGNGGNRKGSETIAGEASGSEYDWSDDWGDDWGSKSKGQVGEREGLAKEKGAAADDDFALNDTPKINITFDGSGKQLNFLNGSANCTSVLQTSKTAWGSSWDALDEGKDAGGFGYGLSVFKSTTAGSDRKDNGWDSGFGKKTAAEELTEPAATITETVSEVSSVNPFMGLSKSQKKKLEKRMKDEAIRDAAELQRITDEEAELRLLKDKE